MQLMPPSNVSINLCVVSCSTSLVGGAIDSRLITCCVVETATKWFEMDQAMVFDFLCRGSGNDRPEGIGHYRATSFLCPKENLHFKESICECQARPWPIFCSSVGSLTILMVQNGKPSQAGVIKEAEDVSSFVWKLVRMNFEIWLSL